MSSDDRGLIRYGHYVMGFSHSLGLAYVIVGAVASYRYDDSMFDRTGWYSE